MGGPLVKTLTVNAVNTLLADYLTSVFQWEAGRVVVETQAGPRPPSGVYATLWWKGQELLQQGMGDFTLPESPEDEGVQSLGNEGSGFRPGAGRLQPRRRSAVRP